MLPIRTHLLPKYGLSDGSFGLASPAEGLLILVATAKGNIVFSRFRGTTSQYLDEISPVFHPCLHVLPRRKLDSIFGPPSQVQPAETGGPGPAARTPALSRLRLTWDVIAPGDLSSTNHCNNGLVSRAVGMPAQPGKHIDWHA